MTHWNPDSTPFIVGNTVYDAFSLAWQLYNSIDKRYDLEDRPEVLDRAERVREGLIEFYLLQKEVRKLKPSSMYKDSRRTLEDLILERDNIIEFIRCLISAFVDFCVQDQGILTEDYFMAGFIGARDPAQAAAMDYLVETTLEKWFRGFKRLEARLDDSEDER